MTERRPCTHQAPDSCPWCDGTEQDEAELAVARRIRMNRAEHGSALVLAPRAERYADEFDQW